MVRRRIRSSVRTRVLAALIGLSALTLVASGTTAYFLERARMIERMDATMESSTQEFRTLATDGVDPETGEPFASVHALLTTAMKRIVTSPNEGMLGFIGETVELVPRSGPTQAWLDEDPGLVPGLAGASAADEARPPFDLTTDVRTYRVLATPVSSEGAGDRGALVLAFDYDAEHAALLGTFRTYALVAGGAILWITLIGWFVVGQLLEPITLLRTTAQEISSSDLSRRIRVVGNDDLAVLTETVNDMLARLEEAFSSQRQLLDDVGHELRTPLTIVRGHLELMDPGDPDDAASTRALALDELDRMNGLVDDLVTLAKARRPDFVRSEPVDAALLTDEVLTKASTLGDRRWTLDGLADVTVQADPQRITQALLQLASNAVKFSEPGSTVAFGSEVVGPEVRFWVRDEGIGIAPDDASRVFDRFQRVQSGTEGSGLGLTIVRSIAHAHGGRTSIDSTLGAGTTVSLYLPLDPEGTDAAPGPSAPAAVTERAPDHSEAP